MDLPWHNCAVCLYYFRNSPRHRLPHVPLLPSASYRGPPSPYPTYACWNARSLDWPDQFLLADTPALFETPSCPRPDLRYFCVYWRCNRSCPGYWPSGLARNLNAGGSLDRLYQRCSNRREKSPNRSASSVDGAFLRRDVYVCLQPFAQPLAPLLEPPW